MVLIFVGLILIEIFLNISKFFFFWSFLLVFISLFFVLIKFFDFFVNFFIVLIFLLRIVCLLKYKFILIRLVNIFIFMLLNRLFRWWRRFFFVVFFVVLIVFGLRLFFCDIWECKFLELLGLIILIIFFFCILVYCKKMLILFGYVWIDVLIVLFLVILGW